MTIRRSAKRGWDGRVAQLEVENAQLRKLARGLAADVGKLRAKSAVRDAGGAQGPARRLLIVVPPDPPPV
jgi:hypothetical protein